MSTLQDLFDALRTASVPDGHERDLAHLADVLARSRRRLPPAELTQAAIAALLDRNPTATDPWHGADGSPTPRRPMHLR